MATPLLKIKVLEKKENTILAEFKIINPAEYYFYEKGSFVLQLIWEPIQIFDLIKSPIAKEIHVNNILDEKWVLNNHKKYIKSVKIISTKNYPNKDQLMKMDRNEFDKFRKENGAPEAIFQIEGTEKKWIEHLEPGMEWDSTSYDIEN